MPIRAIEVNEGGPTAMNMPGRRLTSGRPSTISRYMNNAIIISEIRKPRPWKETPATMIEMRRSVGCVALMLAAIVPVIIAGKTGRIHAGVIEWIVMCSRKVSMEKSDDKKLDEVKLTLPAQKSTEYCVMATMKVAPA